MVTARFLVGTKSEDADPARPREDPRQSRPHSGRHPRAADRRARHQRRRRHRADAVAEARAPPSRWTDKDLYELADKLRAEVDQGRQHRPDLHLRRRRPADPGRARSGEAVAVRRARCSSSSAKVSDANRSFLAGQVRDAGTGRAASSPGQTLAGVPDIGLLLISTRDGRPVYVRDVATVVIGPNAQRAPRLERRARRQGQWQRVPAVSLAWPSAPAPTRWWSPRRFCAPARGAEGRA